MFYATLKEAPSLPWEFLDEEIHSQTKRLEDKCAEIFFKRNEYEIYCELSFSTRSLFIKI